MIESIHSNMVVLVGHPFWRYLFHLLFGTHPNWPDTMAVDAELEVANRNILLARVNASDALVLTGHMPFPGMGFISEQGNGYRWMPASS